jgi:hypothetical protein
MNDFKEADEWSGGAWLTAGNDSAVILVGTKAIGNSWYGFANGVVYPTDPDATEFPEVPPFPYDQRGWWSEDIRARIIFFNPDDLAAVASGTMQPHEPQPYASLDVDQYLFDPGFDLEREKRYLLGAASFDRARGLLYIVERRADEEKSLVHVWKIRGTPVEPPEAPIQVDSEQSMVHVSFRPGQRIHLRTKTEVGARIWVLVELPDLYPGLTFARPFDAYCAERGKYLFPFQDQGNLVPEADSLHYVDPCPSDRIDFGENDFSGLGTIRITTSRGPTSEALESIQQIVLTPN